MNKLFSFKTIHSELRDKKEKEQKKHILFFLLFPIKYLRREIWGFGDLS